MSTSDATGVRRSWIEISDPVSLPGRPLVSVLMLAYNHGQYLAAAIEGVRMQDAVFQIELVIGEDCSPDNTREVALDYQRRYPRLIRVITSDANVGMQENLRRVFEASRGDFLAFCEGDDYWTAQDKLSRQLAVFAARSEVAICFHAALVFDHASQRVVREIRRNTRARDFSLSEVILGGGGMIPSASMVLRRMVLCPMDDWLLKCPVGDYPMAMWAASLGVCHGLPDTMSVYRAGLPSSWSSSVLDADNYWKHVVGVIAMLEELPRKTGRTDVEWAVARAVRRYLRDFHMWFGGPATRAVPRRPVLESRLSWLDRVFVAACNIPTLLWVIKNFVARWRRLANWFASRL